MTDQSARLDASIATIRDKANGPEFEAAPALGRAALDVLEELGFSRREISSADDLLHLLLLTERPPLRAFTIRDLKNPSASSTGLPHLPTLEACVVERGLSLAHMKSVILKVLSRALGEGTKSSFSPIFDPVFAPGFGILLETPIRDHSPFLEGYPRRWVEVGKAGMIHPNMFESRDYDSDIYSGFILELRLDLLNQFKTAPL